MQIQIGGAMKKQVEKKCRKYILTFRFGECPSGEFQYSIIYARTKQLALDIAYDCYGNYAPYRILTPQMFDKSEVKLLGATPFEKVIRTENGIIKEKIAS